MRALAMAGFAVAAALGFATTAQAGTVSLSVDASGVTTYSFAAAPGKTNNLTIDTPGAGVSFEDTGAPITSVVCAAESANRVLCAAPVGAAKLSVAADDGNDNINVATGAAYTAFAGPNTFDGGAGDDSFSTTSGPDQILGGPGSDTINAQDGDDTIDGGEGDDFIGGYAGNDSIVGGPGRDHITGDYGDDTIDTRDRPAGIDVPPFPDPFYDWVTCGDGNDTFYPDLSESSAIAPQDSCENVIQPARPAPTGPAPTGPAPTPTPAPTVAPPSRPAATRGQGALKLKKGIVSVKIDCAASGGDCIGELRLLSGKSTVAKGKFSVDNGTKKDAIKLKLSSAGKKLAKKKKSLKLKLVAVVAGKQTALGSVTVKTG